MRELGHRDTNGMNTTMLFVDLKAAYDSVDLVRLMGII